MTRTCWSRTEQKTRKVVGKSSSLRSPACQQWEIRKERESIRVKSGIALGVLREGPHAQQSSNMSDEAARGWEIRVEREVHQSKSGQCTQYLERRTLRTMESKYGQWDREDGAGHYEENFAREKYDYVKSVIMNGLYVWTRNGCMGSRIPV